MNKNLILLNCVLSLLIVGLLEDYLPKPKAPQNAEISVTEGSYEVDPCWLSSVVCPNEVEARITKYGWTGNRMANGEYPHVGAVASSDRSIPFGTRVQINGEWYTVKDRTALWVHTDKGLTFDIYSEESREEMLKFGAKKLSVMYE